MKRLFILGSLCLFNACLQEETTTQDTVGCHSEVETADYTYDFNDIEELYWSGPAKAEIEDQQLVISSKRGYLWHTIEYDQDNHYSKGKIAFDFQPQDGRYSFETKGSAKTGEFSWGIYTYFQYDTVYTAVSEDSERTLVATGHTYKPFEWYRVELEFDSEAGEKGEFDFWMTPLEDCSERIFIGTFTYDAQHGPLQGVNQFSIGTGDVNQEEIKVSRFDNIQFWVDQEFNTGR